MISLKRMLLFMLCLNLGCWMVATLFPGSALFKPVIPVSYEDMAGQVQSLAATDPTGMVTLLVGYVWPALVMIVNVLGWALFGFPTLLINLGVPSVISYPILTVWGVCFFYGLIEFMAGRHA